LWCSGAEDEPVFVVVVVPQVALRQATPA
jgi:hypothetical protein